MSLANEDSPCRQVNSVLVPGGYLDTWCKNNNAKTSLKALYRIRFLSEAIYGYNAQLNTPTAQLVPFYRGSQDPIYVGMSMCPAIYLTNFYLLYILNPRLAAAMPDSWEYIPTEVYRALTDSNKGMVPYKDVKDYLTNSAKLNV
jgi:hypothetical protein